MKNIRIGTRSSQLALKQTQMVIDSIKATGNYIFEIVPITTTGDKIQNKPLYDIGGKALFLKEIEEALLTDKIDIAVHSMKDVPATLPDGLIITAVLEREDPRDVLISRKANSISTLPRGATIGTSSVRRRAQILHIRPDIEIHSIRGNVPTRLDKWRDMSLDGIVLAAAGIKRLGLHDFAYCHILSEEEMLPAVCQGIIAVEVRDNDQEMKTICASINHKETWQLMRAERGFLEYINGDCRTPLGALARFETGKIHASYMLAGENLEYYKTYQSFSEIADGYEMGVSIAKKMVHSKN